MSFVRMSLVLGGIVVFAVGASPASADKCTAAKLKAIAKVESGVLACHSKVAAKGDPNFLASCVGKVEGKYTAAFTKAGTCSGDQTLCESIAETCANVIRNDDLSDAGPSKCEAARLKAAAKKAADKLKCNVNAAAK